MGSSCGLYNSTDIILAYILDPAKMKKFNLL